MPILGAGSSGTEIDVLALVRAAVSPASVAANTTAEQSLVVPDLTSGGALSVARLQQCAVIASKPTAQAGLGIVGARVIDGTHIGVTFSNNTAGAIVPTAAETYNFALIG